MLSNVHLYIMQSLKHIRLRQQPCVCVCVGGARGGLRGVWNRCCWFFNQTSLHVPLWMNFMFDVVNEDAGVYICFDGSNFKVNRNVHIWCVHYKRVFYCYCVYDWCLLIEVCFPFAPQPFFENELNCSTRCKCTWFSLCFWPEILWSGRWGWGKSRLSKSVV